MSHTNRGVRAADGRPREPQPAVKRSFPFAGRDSTERFPPATEKLLPRPPPIPANRSVLSLGTTGSGKRNTGSILLGTDQRSERFPHHSTAKTTIADTEFSPTDSVTTISWPPSFPDTVRDRLRRQSTPSRAVLDAKTDVRS